MGQEIGVNGNGKSCCVSHISNSKSLSRECEIELVSRIKDSDIDAYNEWIRSDLRFSVDVV